MITSLRFIGLLADSLTLRQKDVVPKATHGNKTTTAKTICIFKQEAVVIVLLGQGIKELNSILFYHSKKTQKK